VTAPGGPHRWPKASLACDDAARTLLPGETVTVPVLLRAPASPGDAIVHVTLVEETGHVFDAGVPINVDVR
jgi:hypothetical protein